MNNPYTPPPIDASQLSSSIHLYSSGHVAWASFLGSPVAGGILMGINYFRLRKPAAGYISLIVGLILAVGFMVLAFYLPDGFPNSVLPIVSTLGMYQAAKLSQGEQYNEHLAYGGAKGSAWVATGIGLLCMIIVLALIFGVLLSVPEDWIPE